MTSLFVPTDIESKILSQAPTEDIALHIKDAINNIQYGIFKKKVFGKKTVYTINVDYKGAHRLIFEMLNVDQVGEVLVLRNIAYNHNYSKALNWSSHSHITYRDFVTSYKTVQQPYKLEIETSEVEETYIRFDQQWILPNEVQSTILKKNQFPQLIVGPPGAGKTLLSIAIMQEQALNHQLQDNDTTFKMRYISPHPDLNRQCKQEWDDWASENICKQGPPIQVQFTSFDELILEFALREKRTIVNDTQALTWIERYIQTKKMNINPAKLLLEFCSSSYLLNEDLKKNLSFEESSYNHKVGIKQSHIHVDKKSFAYLAYKDFVVSINTRSELYPSMFMVPPVLDSDKFDLIFVDEAQNTLMKDLLSVLGMAKGNLSIVYCGDSHQCNEDAHSPLPDLGGTLYSISDGKIKLEVSTLNTSHRLLPATSYLCNELILLDSAVRCGVVDKTAYPCFEVKASNQSGGIYTSQTSDVFKTLGAHAKSVGIVFNSEDKIKATRLLGSSNVIPVRTASGLQFQNIILYISNALLKHLEVFSQGMAKQNIKPGTTLKIVRNAPSEKGEGKDHTKVIHDLYIALSRSYGDVWVYFEDIQKPLEHKVKFFIDWFRSMCQERNEVSLQRSTSEDWLQMINLFIKAKCYHQAQDNLIVHFSISEDLVASYLEHCANIGVISEVSSFNQWIEAKKAQSTSLISQNDAILAQHEKVPASLSEPKDKEALSKSNTSEEASSTQKQNLQSEFSLFGKKVQEQESYKALGSSWANFIEGFVNNINSTNLISLLSSSNIRQKLFIHKMKNGLCLFVNLHLSFYKKAVFDKLLKEIEPKLKAKYESACENIYELAKSQQDICLMLVYGNEYNVPSKLDDIREITFGKLFSKYQTNASVMRYIINNSIYLKLKEEDYISQEINEAGQLHPSFLHLLTFYCHEDISLQNFVKMRWNSLENIISKALGLTVTAFEPMLYAFNILFCLFPVHTNDSFFSSMPLNYLRGISSTILFHKAYRPKSGCMLLHSPILTILKHKDIIKYMNLNWSSFEDSFKTFFFDKDYCPDDNILETPVFNGLVRSNQGRLLLSNKWDFFKTILNRKSFYQSQSYVNGEYEYTPLIYLLCLDDDLRFMKNHFDFFSQIMTEEFILQTFSSPERKQDSIFIILCLNINGREFLKRHYSDLYKDFERRAARCNYGVKSETEYAQLIIDAALHITSGKSSENALKTPM